MANLLRNRVTLVWLLLVGATLISFESGTSGHSRGARAFVLAIAFAKAVAVGREFMELREAPRWMLLAFQAWAAIICAVLVALVW